MATVEEVGKEVESIGRADDIADVHRPLYKVCNMRSLTFVKRELDISGRVYCIVLVLMSTLYLPVAGGEVLNGPSCPLHSISTVRILLRHSQVQEGHLWLPQQ